MSRRMRSSPSSTAAISTHGIRSPSPSRPRLRDDPNAPSITKVETLFIDPSDGIGRIRVFGKKFGIQDAADFPVDDYLCNCFERLNISGYRACGVLGDDHGTVHLTPAPPDLKKDFDYDQGGEKGGPLALSRRVEERDRICRRLGRPWREYQDKLRDRITAGVNSRNPRIRVEKAEVIKCQRPDDRHLFRVHAAPRATPGRSGWLVWT